MREKKEDRLRGLKSRYTNAIAVLSEICNEIGMSYSEYFSSYTEELADTLPELELQRVTEQIREIVENLLKINYLDTWVNEAQKSFENTELKELLNSMNIMIKMEPVDSFTHFSSFFELLQGLNSEDKKLFDATIEKIQVGAKELSTAGIINSYGELTRTKYRAQVLDAIFDGIEQSKDKNKRKYIASYFNEVTQREL